MSQEKLFNEEKKVVTAEEIAAKKEEERLEKLCSVCKEKERIWDVNIRDKCEDCLRDHFIEEFKKIGLDEKGFKDTGESYLFYSHTTGEEVVDKNRILAVIDGFFSNEIFGYSIQTCDEFGCFSNCLGVTTEFAEFLIKELGLEKEDGEEFTCCKSDGTQEETKSSNWINKKIIPDENAKKIAENKKKLAEKRKDMMETINEIKNLEK